MESHKLPCLRHTLQRNSWPKAKYEPQNLTKGLSIHLALLLLAGVALGSAAWRLPAGGTLSGFSTFSGLVFALAAAVFGAAFAVG